MTGLTLAAIYGPYLLLIFVEGARQNCTNILSIWPIFPGLTLSWTIAALGFRPELKGMGSACLLTLGFLALSQFAVWRSGRWFWQTLVGIMLASTGLVYVVVLGLRA